MNRLSRALLLFGMAFSLIHLKAQTVTLAWDRVTEATGYRLYQSLSGAPWTLAIEGATTSATVPVVTNSTRYYVVSWNLVGESAPSNIVTNVVTVTQPPPTNPPPATVPPVPTNLRAHQVTGHRIDIGWTVGDLTARTEVWRAMEGSSFRLMATMSPGVTFFSDQSFQKRKDYIYRVRSCNGVGCSGFSNDLVYSTQ